MSIKEKFERLRWEWMQNLGKTRYLWRCIFGGSLYFGVFFYPWLAGLTLALGWPPSDSPYPSFAGFISSFVSGGLGGYIYGMWEWGRHERKHQTTSSSIPAA